MGKIRLEEGTGQAPSARPLPGMAVYLAVDLSRTKWVYCARWAGQEQRRLSTPPGLEHLQALVQQYAGHSLHVAYEACGFGYEAAWWLHEQQIAVTVIAPSRVPRVPGLAVKTDRLDVGQMARQLEERQLQGIYVPRRAEHQWRQLARTYAQAVQERQRAQVRVRSLLQEQGRLGPAPRAGWPAYASWLSQQTVPEPVQHCVDSLLALRAGADREARRLHLRLRAAAALPAYRAVVRALREQPGVGPLAAVRFAMELGAIARFRSPAALAHYLGVTPSEYSSGEVIKRGHVRKCGRRCCAPHCCSVRGWRCAATRRCARCSSAWHRAWAASAPLSLSPAGSPSSCGTGGRRPPPPSRPASEARTSPHLAPFIGPPRVSACCVMVRLGAHVPEFGGTRSAWAGGGSGHER